VTNIGGGGTGALSVAITGPQAADFAQKSTCPETLDAGGNCTVSVTVSPSALGPRNATLSVSSSPGGSSTAALEAT
jgi:hypothetical protein